MNLFTTLNRGIALSGVYAREIQLRREKQEAKDRYVLAALEECRQLWLNALLVDQTRCWLSISERDKGVINGLVTLLSAAAFAKKHDDNGYLDSPEINVIRGAISAATQCSQGGCVIAVADARAFNSAAEHARIIFQDCSPGAIEHAAQQLHNIANGG